MHEIDLADPEVLADPFTAYGRAREAGPVARLPMPGIGTVWVLTRHEDARAMLGDPRFALTSASFLRPDVPEHCLRYMRSMAEMNGAEHKRLRRTVSPAFSVRHARSLAPVIERIVGRLLDALPDGDPVDLVPHLTRPLPIEVICELVGIPEADRPRWHEYGASVASGAGPAFAEAVPRFIADAIAAVERARADPGDDVLGTLVGTEDLAETDLVMLVWNLMLAGQTPTNLIANAVGHLLTDPDALAALRADPGLLPGAVEELIRWCGPTLLTIPRYATEDLDLHGTPVAKGEAVCVSVAAAHRDPRAYADPDRFDPRRPAGPPGHLGFGHGPHFCLGAALARTQTEVAIGALLDRFPRLALAGDLAALRAPDPGTWRLSALPVSR
nr:cytochrome P450 [Actinophytocola xinjiangensis]